MTSSYTLNQGIEKPATGDQSGTWGATVNTNMDIIDRVVSGVGALTLTGSTTTLTTTDGTLTDGMYRVLVLGDGGDLGSNNTITISPNDQDKLYLVYNNLTANRSAIFSQGSGDNATVENGETAWIYADGAGSGAAVRVATSSTKLLDQDGDTGIRVEEGGDDDDTIRFDIAGAEDFTITANTLTAAASSVVALDDGAVATPSLTTTGDLNTGIYFPAADTVGVVAGGTEQFRFGSNPVPGGAKNSVTNGAMIVDQRGSTADMGDTNGNTYGGPDRFCVHAAGSPQGRGTVTQDTTVLAGSGQSKSYKFDCTTAESAVAAGELIAIQQRFEGQDIQNWMYGQTNAVTLTLSFDFRSPKSGTHCVGFYAMDDNKHYIVEFTVASADTFEHFKITVALPASGTDIVADSSDGFRITWPLVCGSSYQGSAGAWASNDRYATSNQQNLLDSTANNIYLSGVQLEVGGVATDFAHEDVGTTLQKCLRYYQAIEGTTSLEWTAVIDSATSSYANWRLPVQMRATPTVTINAGGSDTVYTAGVQRFSSYGSSYAYTNDSGYQNIQLSGATAGFAGRWAADTGFYLRWSAEL